MLLLTTGSAALLAGCGGGGSNGNTGGIGTTGTTNTGTATNSGGTTNTGTNNQSQVAGKVTDISGKGVPGVSIAVDSGGQITSTITTGGYRLTNLSGGVAHKISAFATVNGVQYSGSTQVYTALDAATGQAGLATNGNILLSPVTQQTTVQGTVRDTTGKPVSGAGVYLAVPISTGTGNYSSLAAFTDSAGVYVIANVPASGLPPGGLLLTASTSGAANQTVTLAQSSVTPGNTVVQNFTLAALGAGAAADTPTVLAAMSYTQPSSGLTTSALQARLSSGSLASGTVYETLRRSLSPTYAAYTSRRHAFGKRLASRATTGGYAIEMDLAFNPPAATNTNLGYYNIYRTTGALPVVGIIESKDNFYDTLFDPLASYYTDVTATTDAVGTISNFNPYTGGTTYNFAMSSVSTTKSESPISTPAVTITPLGPLTLNAPIVNSAVTSPVTLSWTPVTGATHYFVYIYAQFPGIHSSAINPNPAALPTGTSSATVTLTGGGTTYYAIVVATADETEIAGASAPVPNAAQSYSAITPFTVQ